MHLKNLQGRDPTLDMVLAVKALAETDGTFEGYASTFGNVDQGGDIVEPGAFIESIVRAKADRRVIPMLWMHDHAEPIGVWDDIAEDAKGLYVKGRFILDGDPVAQRIYGKLKAGAIGGMSIGYRIPAGGAAEDSQRPNVTRLKKIDLREISLVTMPMNIQARPTRVKSDDLRAECRDIFAKGGTPPLDLLEKCLSDLGFPKTLAVAFVSCGKAAFRRSDSGAGTINAARFLEALQRG